MSLLKKAVNQQAFAKVGIFGESGAGKTHTAMLIAQGILGRIKGGKMAFLDTETGSDWWVPRMPGGVDLFVHKSKAFKDLVAVIDECVAGGYPVLVIDSLTHVWGELCETYFTDINAERKAKGLRARMRMEIDDWKAVKGKGAWQDFADRFVNSPVHIIACGRGGYEWEFQQGEDGRRDLIKTDTKMKAEGAFGYEPSLVIEMSRVTETDLEIERLPLKQRKIAQARAGSKDKHRAYVRKDRADLLDGQHFDDPTFENFAPHFNTLNLGGEHFGVDTTRSSAGMFEPEGDGQYRHEQKRRDTYLDELKELLTKHLPGQGAFEKKARADVAEAVYETRSWEALQGYDADTLKRGLEQARWLFEGADRERREQALGAGYSADGKRVEDGDAARRAIRQMLDEHLDDLRAEAQAETDALDFPAPEEKTANA